MKGLATLIRLAKRELDELKRRQTSMEMQKDQLYLTIERLHEELRVEQALAEKTMEMASFYGGFAKRIKEREETIRAEIKKIDEALIKLSDEIIIAFADLKKYEIAQENAKARKKAEDNRKETIMFDDIAGQQFLRKQKEEG